VSKEAVDLVNFTDDGWDVMLSQYEESNENQIHVEDTFGSLTLCQITDLPEMKSELNHGC
jgi:hypothetical protein